MPAQTPPTRPSSGTPDEPPAPEAPPRRLLRNGDRTTIRLPVLSHSGRKSWPIPLQFHTEDATCPVHRLPNAPRIPFSRRCTSLRSPRLAAAAASMVTRGAAMVPTEPRREDDAIAFAGEPDQVRSRLLRQLLRQRQVEPSIERLTGPRPAFPTRRCRRHASALRAHRRGRRGWPARSWRRCARIDRCPPGVSDAGRPKNSTTVRTRFSR